MITIIIIIGIIIGYVIIGAFHYVIVTLKTDEVLALCTCWIWPITLPIILLFLLGRIFVNIFSRIL